MNLELPVDATSDAAISWLRELLRDFGLGFHPDTPTEDYVRPDGQKSFTPTESDALKTSLGCLFAILGDELPYEICASEASRILAESRGMKPPIEFHDPEFQQQLVLYGSRKEIIDWLCWNDPNGIYTDEALNAEDRPKLTLEQACQIMFEQVKRD